MRDSGARLEPFGISYQESLRKLVRWTTDMNARHIHPCHSVSSLKLYRWYLSSACAVRVRCALTEFTLVVPIASPSDVVCSELDENDPRSIVAVFHSHLHSDIEVCSGLSKIGRWMPVTIVNRICSSSRIALRNEGDTYLVVIIVIC